MNAQAIPLTKLQKEIMREFYSIEHTRVLLNQKERKALWRKVTARSFDIDFAHLRGCCPALEHQIHKSYESGNNIQSAIFSECVYAQTLANMLKLSLFVNCYLNNDFVPDRIQLLLQSYFLVPRYVYSSPDKRRMLIQAGGCNGVDSALISVMDLNIYTIEFKEQYAKTSEPDLPKYGEDGILCITEQKQKRNAPLLRSDEIGVPFSRSGTSAQDITYKLQKNLKIMGWELYYQLP